MNNRIFYDADEVSNMLDVSLGQAYKIIRKLNDELKARGYIVIAGKVSKQFFNEKYYGLHTVV